MEARLQMNFVLLAVDAQNYLVLGNPTVQLDMWTSEIFKINVRNAKGPSLISNKSTGKVDLPFVNLTHSLQPGKRMCSWCLFKSDHFN